MLHVALNATAYDGLPSGALHRAVGIAAALVDAGHRVTVLAPHGRSFAAAVAEERDAGAAGERLVEIDTPLDPGRPLRRALTSGRWLARHLPGDVDLLLTDYYPVLPDVPTALTVHDLRYLAAPEDEPAARVRWFRAFYPRLARRADALVVPTRSVGDACVRLLRADPDRVVVSPNGRSRAWRNGRLAADPASAEAGAHLLAVGMEEPRKGLDVLLAAYARAAERADVLPLVLAGRRGPRTERALEEVADLVAAGRVRHVGPVATDTLIDLMRAASALLHPSRYEGFGMPVVEALGLGVPVVAGRTAAIEEVAGGAAELLPPRDVDAWAGAIAGRREGTAAARRAAVAGYTWAAAAEAVTSRLRPRSR